MNQRQNEILEIRQKVYSKLNKGQNAFSIMKKFKSKVETFLRSFKGDLSYVEEKHWKDKIIITEKAVVRRSKELGAAKESCSKKVEVESLAPSVQEIFEAARAQETIAENLPEPPQEVDEIEKRLEKLKKFNKKWLMNSKVGSAANKRKDKVKNAECETADKMQEVGTNGNDVNTIEKVEDIFDMDVNENTESYNESESDDEVPSNGVIKEYNEQVVDVVVHETVENAVVRSMNDEEYQAEVQEFNNWYYSKVDERMNSKVADKTIKRFYDKIVPTSGSTNVQNVNDDLMYKQVLKGEHNKDKVYMDNNDCSPPSSHPDHAAC